MIEDQAAPIAEMLIDAYLSTAAYSRGFSDEHGQPPTSFAKVHHLRSVVQASVARDERYELGEDYAEFGRVEIKEYDTGQQYLLRSDATVAIEWAKHQETLFDAAQYVDSEVILLVHKFHEAGLDLAVVGTRLQVGRSRVVARGVPSYLGTWPFSDDDGSFDQQQRDPFPDVGEVRDLGEGIE